MSEAPMTDERLEFLERHGGSLIQELCREIRRLRVGVAKDGETMRTLLKTAQGWVDNCPQPEEHKALGLKVEPCTICEDIKADFIAPLSARLEAK